MPSISDGVLGVFDPTRLADGPYVLELKATNTGLLTTTVDQEVNVAGNLKLGNLHLSFTDLTIPVAGIPITITRTYDTLNAGTDGDFGYGWTLNEGDFQLQVSQPDGTLVDAGVLAPFQLGTRVVLTRPGQQPEGFTFEPQPVVSGYSVFANFATPLFVPDPGVADRLSVPATELIDNGDGTYSGEDAKLTSYNPADSLFGAAYTLTTHDGTAYTLKAATGKLASVSDRNGNLLTYEDGGIFSPTGRAVTFTRDYAGRITAIIDPRGNAIVYGYNVSGDLVSVTDRSENKTQIVYSATQPHILDHIVDPFGVTVAQASYTNGRLTGLTDAQENSSTLAYDPTTLGAVITPAQTAPNTPSVPTALKFDSRGNITGTVDGLGHVSSTTYSGNDLTSQTQTTDGRQLTSSYTYDAYGNVLTATGALNNVARLAYNSFGQAISSTDALGNTTRFQYDGHGDLLSATSPAGVTTTYTYDDHGNLKSTSTPNGTTSETYDAYGDVATTTDIHNTTTTYTYDANGNQKTSAWTWVDPSNAANTRDMRTTNVYDAQDRLIQTTAADGTSTETVYDANGRPVWTVDPHLTGDTSLGSHTIYDTDGRVIHTEQFHDVVITISNPNSTHPTSALQSFGDPLWVNSTVYDARGRVLWTDDTHLPGHAVDGTLTLYDDNGNVTGTQRYANVVIDIDNDPVTGMPVGSSLTSHGVQLSSSTTVYDSLGRVHQSTDAADHTTTYQYDDAGRQTEVDDTVNAVVAGTLQSVARSTHSAYDAVGRLISTTDAANHTTRFLYDGRRKGDGGILQRIRFRK